MPSRSRAHQERLDVRLDARELGVRRGDLLPRLEREQRLRRAGRARIERGDAVQFGVHEEERHAHRDLQRVPLGGGELEVGEGAIPVRNRAEVPPACATAREEQMTTTTRAHEVARV